MKLIVGLGNKGKEYNKTRHNVGFMVVDKIMEELNVDSLKEKMGGLYCETIYKNEKIIILKPNRYINLSGEVILEFINYFNIDLKDVIVIHDDMDIEVGKYKIRLKGSSAGHNGLKNIELALGTNEYNRIRVGISRDKNIDMPNYVLSNFNSEDYDIITKVVSEVAGIALEFAITDINNIMNKYNNQEK